jgi:Tol biopolymer transport system component
MVAIMREEPEPLAQLAPKAPVPVRWIVERCLAKDPEDRYASTKDLARDLESVRDHLTETSVSGALEATGPVRTRRRGWILPAAIALVLGAGIALIAGKASGFFQRPPPRFQRLTFRRGAILGARFAPDGVSAIYAAAWNGNPIEIYTARPESPESKSLGLPSANLLSVSGSGELAISLGWRPLIGWESTGMLARVPVTGGAPRELLEGVEDAAWSPDGRELAVVRRVGDRAQLEYPMGKVIGQPVSWLSNPRFSPDGRILAVWEHPDRGDNAGRLVLYDLDRGMRVEGPTVGGAAGFAWSPRGDVVMAGAGVVQRVSPSGKARPSISLAGGFLPEDISRDGTLLAKRANNRREIVGVAAGDSRERNLTWLDWSFPDDISGDGRLLLFDEQSAGRDKYLCYLRKMDGSPAVQLAQGKCFSLSADGRWALGQRLNSNRLFLVPTGAGVVKDLPDSGLVPQWGFFFPDGKRILVWANEPGRGGRLYVQDVDGGGKPRAISPEGFGVSFGGRAISPDGRSVVAVGPDRMINVLSADGGTPRRVPGVTADEGAWGWTADGRSIYVGKIAMPAKVEVCDVATGARRLWKEIVPPDPAGVLAVGPILITPDGGSYAYSYRRSQDDLFLVTGLE